LKPGYRVSSSSLESGAFKLRLSGVRLALGLGSTHGTHLGHAAFEEVDGAVEASVAGNLDIGAF